MLQVYRLNRADEWDRIVRSFREYDVYYLSGYVKNAYRTDGTEALLFFYEDKELRGINVAVRRDVKELPVFSRIHLPRRYSDLVTPYGYGGWLLEGTGDVSALDRAYTAWCRKNNIVSEFVRIHPVIGNERYMEGFYDIIRKGSVVIMDLSSPETVWSNLECNLRSRVRRAREAGLTVSHSNSPEILEEFQTVYRQTMDKVGAADYYYYDADYFRELRKDLPHNMEVFYIRTGDGKIIAATLFLGVNGRLSGHLGGSLQEYLHLNPVCLLHTEAAVWGAENGYRTLNLGSGLGFSEDNLLMSKRDYNRRGLTSHFFGHKVFDPEAYRYLTETAGAGQEKDFFPAYRKQGLTP